MVPTYSCCLPGETALGSSPCCEPHFIRRHFTNDEVRKWLEDYREQLKKELAGVEERISKLGK